MSLDVIQPLSLIWQSISRNYPLLSLSVYHHHHHDPFPGRPCNGRQGHLVEFLTPNISFWGAHTSHIRLCQPFHSCWWGWGVELHSITLDDNHDRAYEEVGRWLCWWSQYWWWWCSVLSGNKTMEIFSHPSHKRMRQTRATIMLLCWLPPPRWVRTSSTKISFWGLSPPSEWWGIAGYCIWIGQICCNATFCISICMVWKFLVGLDCSTECQCQCTHVFTKHCAM